MSNISHQSQMAFWWIDRGSCAAIDQNFFKRKKVDRPHLEVSSQFQILKLEMNVEAWETESSYNSNYLFMYL